MIFETDRLILRKLNKSDFDNLCRILKDENVMYAYEHAFSDKEVTDWLNRQLMRYERDGIGLWAVILKENGQMIGQCGLTYQDCDGETLLEVGYLFEKEYWHHGYATEAAIACKEYAFYNMGENIVYSIIRDNNIASQKVAIRNGMRPIKTMVKHYYGMDMPHIVYGVKKEDV